MSAFSIFFDNVAFFFVDIGSMTKASNKILFLLVFFFGSLFSELFAGTLLDMDTEAVSEFYTAEKAEIQKQTDPEENIINESLAHLGGYYSRPQLVKLLSGSRRVILTFDDGPHPKTTPAVLEILRRRNIKAIFFVLGIQAQKYPELVKQIHDEGHLIGNHSFSHKNLAQISQEKLLDELGRTSAIIEKITGRKPEFLRPPYGAMNRNVIRTAAAEGMKILLWTIDPKDWQHKNESSIVKSVERQFGMSSGDLRGGALLLHDIYPSTVRALEPILDRLATNEYMITSIDRLDSGSVNFWAASNPHLIKKSVFKRTFDPETSGHPLLISMLKTKRPVEHSPMALLKAQKSGSLLVYLFKSGA
jgi:peptidoglycan/xylan/chitin deacetylase (PgdA/CDA1 family)